MDGSLEDFKEEIVAQMGKLPSLVNTYSCGEDEDEEEKGEKEDIKGKDNLAIPQSTKLSEFLRKNLRQSKEQKARELMAAFHQNQWKELADQSKQK